MSSDPKQTGVLMNESIRNISIESYKAAALRVGAIVATCIGADQFLAKTPFGKKIWPNYHTFKIDNRVYTLLIIGLCATQYNIKDKEMVGLTAHNTQLLAEQAKEEAEYVARLEAQKAAAAAKARPPVQPSLATIPPTSQPTQTVALKKGEF